jgi:phytoene dehydrogenase-like protein
MPDGHADVIIVGGGHNGLVAAVLLARTGLRVLLLETNRVFGGAVASAELFDGVQARLSRYSYLVSLMPHQLIDDLGLELELRSRAVASYTPVDDGGLLIESREGEATRRSFAAMTGSGVAYESWRGFHARLEKLATVVAPTLLRPVPRAAEIRAGVGDELWRALTQRPLGEWVEASLPDDTLRGIVLTDALIGTFADARDSGLRQNRCFLYHVIGNGTGEWKVPVGGMGIVAAALERAARKAGAQLRAGTEVIGIMADEGGVTVNVADGAQFRSPYVLVNCAPAVLADLTGAAAPRPEGSQTKINLVVRRLPKLRSGIDPEVAFAGTLHLGQGYRRLRHAYAEAQSGRIPDPLPCEVYCHTLTDPTILSPGLRQQGCHTLTVFGLHTPARLFTEDPATARREVWRAAVHSFKRVLSEPLESCLLADAAGNPCVEVLTPLDVEAAINMPGGHIFHGDLEWPWLSDDAAVSTPAERWGVSTAHPRILVCGSGSTRGGAVSGLGGHSAAMALLETSS